MTESEAIRVLKDFDAQVTAKADGAYQTNIGKMACDAAIKALEEVQQYRQIGTVEECREAVEKQTAIEPEKVVQQLEERTAFLKDCTKYGNKTADQQSKSYDTMMMYEVKDLVDDLLEIVKAGGVDAKTDF